MSAKDSSSLSGEPELPVATKASLRGTEQTALVVRSTVPQGLAYTEYKQYLRVDFFRSCAYCTIAESEATAVRFTIDHYEPKEARPDLIDDYGNLMYSCELCNSYKGDLCPPAAARAEGHRIFRADHELRSEHFKRDSQYLRHKTPVGFFSIEALDLNRLNLRRIRDLRDRVLECDKWVVEGIMGLRGYPLDLLPTGIKLKTVAYLKEAMLAFEDLVEDIDAILREYAGSLNVDPDLEAKERATRRSKSLKEIEAMYPGRRWRAPRAPRAKRKK